MHAYIYTHTHTHTYIYIYTYIHTHIIFRKNGSSLCIASFFSVQFFEANITLYKIS